MAYPNIQVELVDVALLTPTKSSKLTLLPSIVRYTSPLFTVTAVTVPVAVTVSPDESVLL